VSGVLATSRQIALIAIAVIEAATTLASFAESYRGLYLWALGHELTGVAAAGFPLQVDTFLAIGELVLFIGLVDQWPTWSRWPAWLVTVVGLIISVGGNIGHVAGHQLSSRLTAAVPPLAAAAALAIGLGVVKRIVAKRLPADTTAGPAATARALADTAAISADTPAASAAAPRPRTPDKAPGRAPVRRDRVPRTSGEHIRAVVLAQPDTSAEELARQIGRSPRTVRRYRANPNESSAGITSPDESTASDDLSANRRLGNEDGAGIWVPR